jgi:outer membrane protein OmpA-like peptidoglycan-associated protein
MSKKIIYLWLALFFCSCVVSREKYAASLRDAELAKGRLTDQKRSAQREQERLAAQLTQLRQEKMAAEARATLAEQSVSQNAPKIATLSAQLNALESIVTLWRALVYGSILADAPLASSLFIPLLDPITQKPAFIATKAGMTLSAEGSALVKKIAEQLPKNTQTILVLGFAHDTTDDLKMSSEYSLLVAKALLAAGIEGDRLRVSFFGATRGSCNDKEKCTQSQVRVVVIKEGL